MSRKKELFMAKSKIEYFYIGIDPGLSGYIVVISQEGILLHSFPMPIIKGKKNDLNLIALFDYFDNFSTSADIKLAVLEKVHAFPGQGVTSMFRFGECFGAIQMTLTGNRIPYQLVTPQAWQKIMLAGENKKGDKSASIKVAQRLFPDVDLRRTERCTTPDHNKADALLLAEYGRRLVGGK